jgi:hypothetical protein
MPFAPSHFRNAASSFPGTVTSTGGGRSGGFGGAAACNGGRAAQAMPSASMN